MQLAQDIYEAFIVGLLAGDTVKDWEDRLTGLVEFALGEGWQVGVWKDRLSWFPSHIRGPLTYVVGRFYQRPLAHFLVRRNVPPGVNRRWDDEVVGPYFRQALTESLHAPPGSPLKSLVEAALRKLGRRQTP